MKFLNYTQEVSAFAAWGRLGNGERVIMVDRVHQKIYDLQLLSVARASELVKTALDDADRIRSHREKISEWIPDNYDFFVKNICLVEEEPIDIENAPSEVEA